MRILCARSLFQILTTGVISDTLIHDITNHEENTHLSLAPRVRQADLAAAVAMAAPDAKPLRKTNIRVPSVPFSSVSCVVR